MSTWIIPYPVTSQLSRAGVVTWSISISVSQPPLCCFNLLAWKIIERSFIFGYFLMNFIEEKAIRKFRTWWTHWPCHEPLAPDSNCYFMFIIICNNCTGSNSAATLRVERQWKVIYKSSRRYLSAKFPITFDKNAPVQICLDKKLVAIKLLTILQKLTSTCQLCLQSNGIFHPQNVMSCHDN